MKSIFNKPAKHLIQFSDIEDEIKLQIKNGLDMGITLHSCKTAVDNIQKQIFLKIIEKDPKICIVINENSFHQ